MPAASQHPAVARSERSALKRRPERPLSRLRKEVPMYPILYIIGAIVVIVVVLRILGLF
jgi:hypothetical protein